MVWTIFLILVVLWFLGLVSSYTQSACPEPGLFQAIC